MDTTEYPYYQAPFPSYNVAQRAVVPFLDTDTNLVISFQTAVGKTVLAEGAFAYHLSQDDSGRVAYISPFKSLSNEKYTDWSNNFQIAHHGIMLSTGDHMAKPEDYSGSRIAVVTTESFDSKTRNKRYDDGLKSMTCVVFDEAHLLNTPGRGAAMEAAMMRFTTMNPAARLILLSATMSNARQIAQWVKSLNNKATKCIKSDWRPNELDIQHHVVEDGYDPKIDKAVELAAKARFDKKIIVFVHSKSVGNEIVKRLRKRGTKCAFHNASLKPGARSKIERMFSSSTSGLNVLVSTSTLGAGVNVG
jgi:replicative superfamily II helicase